MPAAGRVVAVRKQPAPARRATHQSKHLQLVCFTSTGVSAVPSARAQSLPGSSLAARHQPQGSSPHSTSDLPSLGSLDSTSARHTPAGSTAGSAHGGRAYLGAGSLDSAASDGAGADIESFEEYVAARRNGRSASWRADRTDEASTSSGETLPPKLKPQLGLGDGLL